MRRSAELHQAIARAQDQIRFSQRMLEQYNANYPENGEVERRTRRKLEADVERARNDENILQRSLALETGAAA